MNRYINENDKKMDELLQKYIAGNASEKESQRIMEWLRKNFLKIGDEILQ